MMRNEKHLDWIKSIATSPKTVDGKADAFATLARARARMFRVWEVAFKRDENGERDALPEEFEQVLRNLYDSIQEVDFFLGGVAEGIRLVAPNGRNES